MQDGSFDDNELPPEPFNPGLKAGFLRKGEPPTTGPQAYPVEIDLTPLVLASRGRRLLVNGLTAAGCSVLIGLWIACVVLWNFVGRSPNPMGVLLLLTAVFLAPAAYYLWKLWSVRPGTYPTSMTVDSGAMTLNYPGGARWTAPWGVPSTSLWLTDLTASEYYTARLPSGYYLGVPSRWIGQVWIPGAAFAAVLESARNFGARIERSEPVYLEAESQLSGTVIYHVRGRGG